MRRSSSPSRARPRYRIAAVRRFSTLRERPPAGVCDSIHASSGGWRACYGAGTNIREVPRESIRDQYDRGRRTVQPHVRAGIGKAQSHYRI